MKTKLITFFLLVLAMSSCKVDFTPNADWKDVPSVYCVMDIDEDTVWARVQRCYLGEGDLFSYSSNPDSNNYKQGQIRVVLNAWKANVTSNGHFIQTDELVDSWDMTYSLRLGKPEGSFSSVPQPVYYCVPGNRLSKDTNCVFQLLVIRTDSGDTIASAKTELVGRLLQTDTRGHLHENIENILISPNRVRGCHFGFVPDSRRNMQWCSLPRGRGYQIGIRFYYRKFHDTLSVDILGNIIPNETNKPVMSSNSINKTIFLSTIKNALADNTDSLFNVNYVDISVIVANEDLNLYISTQNDPSIVGQDRTPYTNIEGGVGIFASRRTHIVVRVPSDSTGKEMYLPAELRNLGVGFYGVFEK